MSVIDPLPTVALKETPSPPLESFQSCCGSVTTSLITTTCGAVVDVFVGVKVRVGVFVIVKVCVAVEVEVGVEVRV